MPEQLQIPLESNTPVIIQNLKRLAILRIITFFGLTLALVFIGLENTPYIQAFILWTALLSLLALSTLNIWRAKQGRAYPNELFLYLLFDIILIASIIFVSGGANNPFITYLLVPIVISAATLSWLKTWVLCMIAMTLYGFLLFFYYPLPALDHHLAMAGLSFHIIGMWLTFILSAMLIAYFVVDMAFDLRQKEKQTAHFREQVIQNEHLMLLASQAASTAHELGSPLTTIKMLSHELQRLDHLDQTSKEDLDLINQQIDICQEKLKRLSQTHRLDISEPKSLMSFIQDTTGQWLLMQPKAQFKWAKPFDEYPQGPQVQYPLVLMQAIINLLDNANQASEETIILDICVFSDSWQLIIQDFGEGVDENFVLPSQPMASTDGLGIGLLLSHSSVMRLGGNIQLENNALGCVTRIKVPFHV